jgi:large subunit ribosomal protein L32
MAVPFRRTSKTAKRLRRSHFKLSVSGLNTCPHCGTMIRSHHVCPKCGYYDGKPVVIVPEVEEKVPAKKATAKKPVVKAEKPVAAAPAEIKSTKKTATKKVTTNRIGNRGE